MNKDLVLPHKMRPILRKAFIFASSLLQIRATFYPFAAIKKGNDFECIFLDSNSKKNNSYGMVDELQWKLIDCTTDYSTQSLLAYKTEIHTDQGHKIKAVVFEMCDEDGKDYIYSFSYYWVNEKLRFKGPLTICN